MKPDLELEFFKAVFAEAGLAPVSIGEAVDLATKRQHPELSRQLTGMAVKLLRAAYAVHQRSAMKKRPRAVKPVAF
jgi:hypothetical protein